MLKNISAKKRMLAERERHLQVLLTVSNLYKQSDNKEDKKFYYDFIIWLGTISKKIKEDLENLT